MVFGLSHKSRAERGSHRCAALRQPGYRSALATLGLCALLTLGVFGPGVDEARAQSGAWSSFLSSDGLTGDDIKAIARTDSGTIFIATNRQVVDGLQFRNVGDVVEYDGVSFDTLTNRYPTPPDFSGKFAFDPPKNALITSMALAPNGDIWIGTTEYGVFRLGQASFDHFREIDGLGNRRTNRVSSVLVDRDGIVWAGTREGLSRFDGVTWTTLTVSDGLAAANVTGIAEASDGILWLTLSEFSNGGLTSYDGTTFINFQDPAGGQANFVSGLAVHLDGSFWCTRGGGISVFDSDGTWMKSFTTSNGLASGNVSGITVGHFGEVWVGSSTVGLQRWNGSSWVQFTSSGSELIADNATHLEVDHSGVLWVGTSNGLSRYAGSEVLPLDESHGLEILDLSLGPLSDLPGTPLFGSTRGPVYVAISGPPGGGAARLSGLEIEIALNEVGDTLAGNFVAVAAFAGGFYAGKNDTVFKIEDMKVTERSVLPENRTLQSLFMHSDGTLWAVAWDGSMAHLYRRVGLLWQQIEILDVFPSGDRMKISAEDSMGRIWIALNTGGATRLDPTDLSFEKFSTPQGLLSDSIKDILVSSNDEVWFATFEWVAVLRAGNTIEQVTRDGLPSKNILAISEDQAGRIWVGTVAGLAFFNNEIWTSYGPSDGLPGNQIISLLADTSQAVVGSSTGLALFRPDRLPPIARIVKGPPLVTPFPAAEFISAAGDLSSSNSRVKLSWSLDGEPPSDFSSEKRKTEIGISDGIHTMELWARDRALNVSATPARIVFEIDATPPEPVIESPTFMRSISGIVPVLGDVSDERFRAFQVDVRPGDVEDGWTRLAADSTLPLPGEALASWDTRGVPDGLYVIRLAVSDTFDLVGSDRVNVIVDNQDPRTPETSPAIVRAAEGGRIFTLNAEVEVYFPPRALDQDRIVTIKEVDELSELPPGASRWLGGWEFAPKDFKPNKSVTLAFSLSALDSVVQAGGGDPVPNPGPLGGFEGSSTPLGIFAINADSSYSYLGGTVDGANDAITTTINNLGSFAIFEGLFSSAATSADRDIDIQPRAFSPTGSTFDDRAAISFNLSTGGSVQVYVYNRSGRLVRRAFEGSLGAGRNVVYWDGRDGNGSIVPSGLYIVAVRAGEKTDTKTVGVVNR